VAEMAALFYHCVYEYSDVAMRDPVIRAMLTNREELEQRYARVVLEVQGSRQLFYLCWW